MKGFDVTYTTCVKVEFDTTFFCAAMIEGSGLSTRGLLLDTFNRYSLAEHADVNAARNIRDRFVVSRHDGEPSISPDETRFRREALSTVPVTTVSPARECSQHGR